MLANKLGACVADMLHNLKTRELLGVGGRMLWENSGGVTSTSAVLDFTKYRPPRGAALPELHRGTPVGEADFVFDLDVLPEFRMVTRQQARNSVRNVQHGQEDRSWPASEGVVSF